jgi:CheY-like chemotaxis protein
MNRILLADDSPHAQRMGERILRDEGYEVVSVTDGETALLRLDDVAPDLIICDVFLPVHSGVDVCRFVRGRPKHRHVQVVLAAGMLETFDEAEARAAGADAILRKPFESSVMLETIQPLLAEAERRRSASTVEPVVGEPPAPAKVEPRQEQAAAHVPAPEPPAIPAGAGVSEEELLRAAVTLALDAAFPALVEDITAKVLRNLRSVGNAPSTLDDAPQPPMAQIAASN